MKRPSTDKLMRWFFEAFRDSGKMWVAIRSSYIKWEEARAEIEFGSYKEYEIGGLYWINGTKHYATGEELDEMDVVPEFWAYQVFDMSRFLDHLRSEEDLLKVRQDRAVRIAAFVKVTGHIKTNQKKKNICRAQITDTFCAVIPESSTEAIELGAAPSDCILRLVINDRSSPILLFWVKSLEKLEEK
ncbi:hypothetical protein MYX07_03150 [Patescibacteria group bacterium AH-259-L07]|nr:hypothetical protein [Patescibacteria group bacterium AH-259-L07]